MGTSGKVLRRSLVAMLMLSAMGVLAPAIGAQGTGAATVDWWIPVLAPPPIQIHMVGVSVVMDPSYAESTFMDRIKIDVFGFPESTTGILTVDSTNGDHMAIWLNMHTGSAEFDLPVADVAGVTYTVSFDGFTASTTS